MVANQAGTWPLGRLPEPRTFNVSRPTNLPSTESRCLQTLVSTSHLPTSATPTPLPNESGRLARPPSTVRTSEHLDDSVKGGSVGRDGSRSAF